MKGKKSILGSRWAYLKAESETLNILKHILGSLSLWVSLLLIKSDRPWWTSWSGGWTSTHLGLGRSTDVYLQWLGTLSWEQEAPLEHNPPTGYSWDACPGITQGSNKALFSSLNQASRMGCLLAFVFGADQQTYSGQHNGIVGLQWKVGRGPVLPLSRAHPKNRGSTSHWFGCLTLMLVSDLLIAHKITGSLPTASLNTSIWNHWIAFNSFFPQFHIYHSLAKFFLHILTLAHFFMPKIAL